MMHYCPAIFKKFILSKLNEYYYSAYCSAIAIRNQYCKIEKSITYVFIKIQKVIERILFIKIKYQLIVQPNKIYSANAIRNHYFSAIEMSIHFKIKFNKSNNGICL